MGMKGKTWLAFCVLFLVFFMGMSSIAGAQENVCILPTGTGVVNGLASSLTIIASAEVISPTEPVSLRAAWGCSPFQYTWQIQGMGYTLSRTTTNGDLDYTILTVVGGTCGSDYAMTVTVTVRDACATEARRVIRNANTEWASITPSCPDPNYPYLWDDDGYTNYWWDPDPCDSEEPPQPVNVLSADGLMKWYFGSTRFFGCTSGYNWTDYKYYCLNEGGSDYEEYPTPLPAAPCGSPSGCGGHSGMSAQELICR